MRKKQAVSRDCLKYIFDILFQVRLALARSCFLLHPLWALPPKRKQFQVGNIATRFHILYADLHQTYSEEHGAGNSLTGALLTWPQGAQLAGGGRDVYTEEERYPWLHGVHITQQSAWQCPFSTLQVKLKTQTWWAAICKILFYMLKEYEDTFVLEKPKQFSQVDRTCKHKKLN